MLQTILKERAIPPLRTRTEMLEILQREEYGYLPEKPEAISWQVKDNCIPSFCAGKVTALSVSLTALALLGFSFSSQYWMLLVFAIPYGLGAGSVDAALNNYVAHLIFYLQKRAEN